MKKRILALCLTGVMALGLAACSSGTNPGGATPAPAQTPGAPAATDNGGAPATDRAPIAKEDLKIGFVHIGDASDQGYTYNMELGTKEMAENLGLDYDTQIISKYNCPEDSTCETYVNELVEAGCQIIFGTSFGFEDFMLNVAAEHPEVEFCHATGVQAAASGLANMHNYFANVHEGRYLTGIAAGLKTETNKLGYVSAFPYAEPISGFTAFYLGAKSVNPDVTMDVMYVNSWNAPQKEAQMAQALIDRGCDVIGQHSDTVTPATTAQSNGVWSVGYSTDQIGVAPKSSIISTRIDNGIYLTEAVQAMIDGTPIPTDWSKGAADGAVQLFPLNTDIAAPGTQEAIEKAQAGFADGSLKVFAGPLTGEGVDFGGNKVTLDLKEGEWFHESEGLSAPAFNYIIPGINIVE